MRGGEGSGSQTQALSSMNPLNYIIAACISAIYAFVVWETRLYSMHRFATMALNSEAPITQSFETVHNMINNNMSMLWHEFERISDEQLQQCQASITQQVNIEFNRVSKEVAAFKDEAVEMDGVLVQCQHLLELDCEAKLHNTTFVNNELQQREEANMLIQTSLQDTYFATTREYLQVFDELEQCLDGERCVSGPSLAKRIDTTRNKLIHIQTQLVETAQNHTETIQAQLRDFERFVDEVKARVGGLVSQWPAIKKYPSLRISVLAVPTFKSSSTAIRLTIGKLIDNAKHSANELLSSINMIEHIPPIAPPHITPALITKTFKEHKEVVLRQAPALSLPKSLSLPMMPPMPDFEFLMALETLWQVCGIVLKLIMRLDEVYRVLFIIRIFWNAFVRFGMNDYPIDSRQDNQGVWSYVRMVIGIFLNDTGLVLVGCSFMTVIAFAVVYSPVFQAYDLGCAASLTAAATGTAEMRNFAIAHFGELAQKMNLANARNVQTIQFQANEMCVNGSAFAFAQQSMVENQWLANRTAFANTETCTNDTLAICSDDSFYEALTWITDEWINKTRFWCGDLVSECHYAPQPITLQQVTQSVIVEMCPLEGKFHHSIKIMAMTCMLYAMLAIAAAALSIGLNLLSLQFRRDEKQVAILPCDTKTGEVQFLTEEHWKRDLLQQTRTNCYTGLGLLVAATCLGVTGLVLAPKYFSVAFHALMYSDQMWWVEK